MEKTLFTQSCGIGENMGVDDMQEALEAGFLEGKLCNPVTVKFNDNTNQAIETICNAQGVTVAEWLRDLAINNLVARKREFHRMEKLWGQTKETSATSADKESPVAVTTELDVQNFGVNEQ